MRASRRRDRSSGTSSGSSDPLHYQRDWDSQPGVDPEISGVGTTRGACSGSSTTTSPKPPADARVSQRLLLHPRQSPRASRRRARSDLSHGDNPTPNLVYTGVLSDKTLIEARYSGFWLHSSNDPNEPGRIVWGRDSKTRIPVKSPATSRRGVENRSWRYGLPGEALAPDRRGSGGTHDLKVGRPVRGPRRRHRHRQQRPVSHLQRDRRRPTTGTTQLPYHASSTAQSIGTYVDDTYRLGNAVLNFGVRYDYSKGMFPALPFLDASGQSDRGDVAGQRRRLSLEHVLAARRHQLQGERVGQDRRQGPLRAVLQAARGERVQGGGADGDDVVQLHRRLRAATGRTSPGRGREPAHRSQFQVALQRSVHRSSSSSS